MYDKYIFIEIFHLACSTYFKWNKKLLADIDGLNSINNIYKHYSSDFEYI